MSLFKNKPIMYALLFLLIATDCGELIGTWLNIGFMEAIVKTALPMFVHVFVFTLMMDTEELKDRTLELEKRVDKLEDRK